SSMRCPSAAALALAFAATCAVAAPEAVRKEIVDRVQAQLPQGASADEVAPEASALVAAGQKLWTAKFKDKASLAGCFPNGGRRIAAGYPQYDARVKRVVTLEMAINQCRKVHGEALYEPTDPATMGAVLAYVRSLSNNMKMAVRVPPAAEAR